MRLRTKTYLSDILVPHSAGLLNVCSALGNVLEVVSIDLELVLGVFGCLDINSWGHNNPTDDLLAQEVAAGHHQHVCLKPQGIP
jgi:hypothetical protein